MSSCTKEVHEGGGVLGKVTRERVAAVAQPIPLAAAFRPDPAWAHSGFHCRSREPPVVHASLWPRVRYLAPTLPSLGVYV